METSHTHIEDSNGRQMWNKTLPLIWYMHVRLHCSRPGRRVTQGICVSGAGVDVGVTSASTTAAPPTAGVATLVAIGCSAVVV
jgi:hypothetical protein